MQISALTPHIGAQISGVDLAHGADAATVADILRVLDERGVVVIRDQPLTLDHFMAFSRTLGQLDIHPLRKFSRPGFPELMINSNIIEDGQPIGLADAGRQWHTDGAYLEVPYRATVLYGVEIPMENGVALGDTLFASTSAAYDALAPEMRARLAPLTGVNCHGVGRKKHSKPLDLEDSLKQHIQKGVEHPVVRTHPHTGRKCIYVNSGCTERLAGLGEAESEALLAQLYDHIARAEFVYCHNWRARDLVMWDNCSTQHLAVGDYGAHQRRLLYRTLVKGTPVH